MLHVCYESCAAAPPYLRLPTPGVGGEVFILQPLQVLASDSSLPSPGDCPQARESFLPRSGSPSWGRPHLMMGPEGAAKAQPPSSTSEQLRRAIQPLQPSPKSQRVSFPHSPIDAVNSAPCTSHRQIPISRPVCLLEPNPGWLGPGVVQENRILTNTEFGSWVTHGAKDPS